MRSKQEKALAILEALELADESLVQHALDVDTPEKFQALGHIHLAKHEKPARMRWAAVAACLALVAALASFPWLLSKLPAYNQPTEPPLPPTTGFTEEYDPTEPPALLAFNSQTSVFPIITGYEWHCTHDDDNTVNISSAWINPLSEELEDRIPWLTTEESTLQLKFEWFQDSLRIRCWPADKFGDPDAYEDYAHVTGINSSITLKTGKYIYEVTGQWYNSYWGSGTVTYVFGADSSCQIVQPDMDIQILCGDMALTDLVGGLDTGRRYDDAAEKWIDVMGNGAWWTMHDSVLNGTPLPTVTLTQDLTIKLGPNGTLKEILVYYKHTETSPGLYMVAEDIAQLSTLPVGKWHILLKVTWQGRHIPQAADVEIYDYEYVFILDIPEPATPAYVWDFDENSGTLTVGGCEAMPDFSDTDRWNKPGWESIRDQVQHIIIADGVTRIGNYAFCNMPNLQTVILPDSIREIGDFAFRCAENLSEIHLPVSLVKIGDYAFDECRKLPEIILPEGLKRIGEAAFRFCQLPTSLTIPSSVQHIGRSAFRYCDSLQEVTVLGSSEGMFYTFAGCEKLQVIRFCGDAPNSLDEVADNRIVICYYPSNNSTWTDAVLDTANLYYTVWFASEDPASEQLPGDATSGSCGRTAYWELKDGVLTISGSGDITYVGWENYRNDIKKVVIEDGITSIANSSFYQCGNLTAVTIPESVTSIGVNAFYECKKLKAVTLPQNLEFLGNYAFQRCESITSITIPESLTVIPRMAFCGCVSLKEINFPSGLTQIENAAFQNCTALKEVHFPASLTSLGDYAFSGCSDLRRIYFYGDVPGVHNFTFHQVKATAYYPPGNESWEQGGMKHHNGIITEKPDPYLACVSHDFSEWVVIEAPTRLESGKRERTCKACGYKETEELPPTAYEGEPPEHPELGQIMASGRDHGVIWTLYENRVLTIFGTGSMESSDHYAWMGYRSSICRIIIEEGVTSIANTAFQGMPNLLLVELPNTLTKIGIYAFSGCKSLQSLVIPASVEEIQDYAFGRCDRLKQVYFLGDAPDMAKNIFHMDTLYVYYDLNNQTWIGMTGNYGGLVTWVGTTSLPSPTACWDPRKTWQHT